MAIKVRPDKEMLVDMKDRGMRNTDIAKFFGVGETTVSNWLSRYGMQGEARRKSICPSREKLIEMYDAGLDQSEIATAFGVHRTAVIRWFAKHGIDAKDPIERKQKNIKSFNLDGDAEEFICGSMLGDGHIDSGRVQSSARLTIGVAPKKYAEWYKNMLASFGIEGSDIRERHTLRHGVDFIHHYYRSKHYKELFELRRLFYPDGKKIAPKSLNMTPLTALVWYIDDGMLWHSDRMSDRIQLCTDGFTSDDVHFLMGLLEKEGIPTSYYGNRNRIVINASSVLAFLEYIGPCPEYLLDTYGYKWEARIGKRARNISERARKE